MSRPRRLVRPNTKYSGSDWVLDKPGETKRNRIAASPPPPPSISSSSPSSFLTPASPAAASPSSPLPSSSSSEATSDNQEELLEVDSAPAAPAVDGGPEDLPPSVDELSDPQNEEELINLIKQLWRDPKFAASFGGASAMQRELLLSRDIHVSQKVILKALSGKSS